MSTVEYIALEFVEDINKAGLPIEQQDAYNFAKAFLQYDPPAGMLRKFVASSRFVPMEEFNRDLDKLTELCAFVFDSRPYAALFSQKDKSDYWVYMQLLQRGLNPPAMLCDSEQLDIRQNQYKQEIDIELGENPSFEKIARYFRRPSPFVEWINSVPEELLICTFDDFSISGSVIKGMFPNLHKISPGTSKRFHAFMCYAADSAVKLIQKSGIEAHQVGSNILTLRSSLSIKELRFIENLINNATGNNGGIDKESAVLFWTWYKVPDNIPVIFTGRGFPHLIREECFRPPYKSLNQMG